MGNCCKRAVKPEMVTASVQTQPMQLIESGAVVRNNTFLVREDDTPRSDRTKDTQQQDYTDSDADSSLSNSRLHLPKSPARFSGKVNRVILFD